jgi:hypothetical protein
MRQARVSVRTANVLCVCLLCGLQPWCPVQANQARWMIHVKASPAPGGMQQTRQGNAMKTSYEAV